LEPVSSLLLKRASASRPSGQWNDDDFDVLANGVVVGRIFKANASPVGEMVDVDIGLWASRRSNAHTWLCRNARGCDDGVCPKLAGGNEYQGWRRGHMRGWPRIAVVMSVTWLVVSGFEFCDAHFDCLSGRGR
jgi:hypothetical protein